MKSLSNEEWVTDSDRATTASVLLGLPAEVSQTAEVSQAAEVSEVLSTFEDKSAAALLGNVQQGPKARYQLYQDKKGAWRWSLRAASGEVIAISGTFESKAIALDGFPYFRGTAE